MPTITIDSFTITQSPAQADLHLTTIKYTYTLNCTEIECAIEETATIKIDIINDDSDVTVASSQDTHTATCTDGYTIRNPKGEEEEVECGFRTSRELVVGQSLLNTTLGSDDIKITLKGSPTTGGLIDSVTSNTVVVNY